MKIINRTNVKIRKILYGWAKKAHLNTKEVRVEILPAEKYIHGLCNFNIRKITLWVFDDSSPEEIGFLFLHEMFHLKKRNQDLWTNGRKRKAQRDANRFAEKITGINLYQIRWRG